MQVAILIVIFRCKVSDSVIARIGYQNLVVNDHGSTADLNRIISDEIEYFRIAIG